MAKERVQVQGLGDAVPAIQPTIQRGGQYAVQVQRAGRNKGSYIILVQLFT